MRELVRHVESGLWHRSLEEFGSCAHEGAIDRSAVTRVAFYHPEYAMDGDFEPSEFCEEEDQHLHRDLHRARRVRARKASARFFNLPETRLLATVPGIEEALREGWPSKAARRFANDGALDVCAAEASKGHPPVLVIQNPHSAGLVATHG